MCKYYSRKQNLGEVAEDEADLVAVFCLCERVVLAAMIQLELLVKLLPNPNWSIG